MTTPLLQTTSIAKRFGPVIALRSVDLVVAPGEVHAVLGANGAGKSTLVKILSGVFAPDGGTVEVSGARIAARKPTDALDAGFATVFQDPALVPDLTLHENFRLTGADTATIGSWLSRFELHNLDLAMPVREVPLEMLRLIDLARALSTNPKILILDEITAALPSDKAAHVFEVMRYQRDQGLSVLFITHRLDEVLQMCDSATILRDGHNAATLDPGKGDQATLVEAMLGEVPAERDIEPDSLRDISAQPVALQADNLVSGSHVRGLDLELRSGEILGVAALEGQGQERLFELLAGDRRPHQGRILVNGEELRARSPYDAIRRGVVLVPGDRLRALLPNRSVRENLAAPLYNRIGRWFGLQRDEPAKVDSAIDRLSIDIRAQGRVRQLSGGNQQKVVIGRWLAAGFRTLLLFDPTRGIDIQTKQQIYALLHELAAEGAAILIYTSELPEIPQVCDRVLVMYDGKIVDEQHGPTATEASMLSAAHGLQAQGTDPGSGSLEAGARS
jgi:ribose transport system ATP-binding protein